MATESEAARANEVEDSEQPYRFNDDLLISARDQVEAAKLYGSIDYALNHEALRDWLVRIDPAANDAKRRSRLWGCWAVMLVGTALLCASAEPLYAAHHEVAWWVAAVSALLGFAGAVIGWFGLLFASNKRSWLEKRLITEQLRLFHFRTLLTLSHLILAGRKEDFETARVAAFAAFEADILKRPGLTLDAILDSEGFDKHLSVVIPPLPDPVDQAAATAFVAAYGRLRIQRQFDYAQYKLQRDGKLFSAFPRQQAAVLDWAALLCVAGVVAVHVAVIGDIAATGGVLVGSWVPVAGVWLAISALALKTLQEGLQSKLEAERYRHYRSAIKAAADRFEDAASLQEKLTVAVSVERASADEMLIFLRSSAESRFIM